MSSVNDRIKHLINELNVDQATLPTRVDGYAVGDWVNVIGDWVNVVEYNPKLRTTIAQTTFSSSNNPGDLELIKKEGPYWVIKSEEGRYYKIGNRELTANNNFQKLDSELYEGVMLDEGFREIFNDLTVKLKKGIITASAVIAMVTANAQEPQKVDKLLDTVGQFGNKELLNDLRAASGIEWDETTANKLFKFSPDKPKEVNGKSDLDLGAYSKINVAKVINSNHTESGGIKYTVDISDKRYLESGKIFDKIKEYNDTLRNIQIDFTYKGTPLPTRTINL